MNVLPVEQPRIFGIETEYGLHPNPKGSIYMSMIEDVLPPYLHLAETTNDTPHGFLEYGRIYQDQMKNVEVCTPELLTLDGLLASHFAGEALARHICSNLFKDSETWLGNEQPVGIKRSIDSNLQSRGEHDNFLVGKDFNEALQEALCTHLMTRIVLTGCGGIVRPNKISPYQFVVDQRAFVSGGDELIDNSSTGDSKPFIKSTSKNYAGVAATQRLQVVSSSQNMFAYPVAARIFNTSSVMRLLEQDKYPSHLRFTKAPQHVYAALHRIALDPGLTETLAMDTGRELTAVQVQQELMAAALKLDLPDDEKYMANLSGGIAADLEFGYREAWKEHVEWVAKQRLFEAHAGKHDYKFPGAISARKDILWHELSPRGFAVKLRELGRVAMMPGEGAIEAAKRMPPDETRGLARARAIAAAAAKGFRMKEASWDAWRSPGTREVRMGDPWAENYFSNANAGQVA
jgi:proteasome accessory factor A